MSVLGFIAVKTRNPTAGLMVINMNFWGLIDDCRRTSHDDLLAFSAAWEQRLAAMDPDQVDDVYQGLYRAMEGLSDWRIFGAAWLFSGGSRDDFMIRFCEWVIAHGEDFYTEVQMNPDKIPQMKPMQGRWCEAKLGSILRHIAVTKHGKSWEDHPDHSLWQALVSKLDVEIKPKASNTLVCMKLKKSSPVQPDGWAGRFPHLNAWCERRQVKPAHDRRTPMTYEKFWLLVDDAKSCHDASAFLTYSLQCLPTSQIVDFDAILDDVLNRADGAISEIRATDPGVESLSDEEIGTLLVVMGKEVYAAVLQDPAVWSDVQEQCARWKGQRLRHAAHQAFLTKTGHAAEPLVA